MDALNVFFRGSTKQPFRWIFAKSAQVLHWARGARSERARGNLRRRTGDNPERVRRRFPVDGPSFPEEGAQARRDLRGGQVQQEGRRGVPLGSQVRPERFQRRVHRGRVLAPRCQQGADRDYSHAAVRGCQCQPAEQGAPKSSATRVEQGWHPAGPCLRWRPQLRVCCGSSIAYASAHAAPCHPAARGRPLTRSLAPWQLGQTALHCAAGYGALEVVKVLVDGGADKSITDLDGNTACELAKNYGARSPPALLVFSRVHSPLPRALGLSGQAEVVNMLS